MATSDEGAVRGHQASDPTLSVDSTPGLESEYYLAEGQRLSHEGNWTLDRAEFTYWSPELFQMHGLDPGRKPPTVVVVGITLFLLIWYGSRSKTDLPWLKRPLMAYACKRRTQTKIAVG